MSHQLKENHCDNSVPKGSILKGLFNFPLKSEKIINSLKKMNNSLSVENLRTNKIVIVSDE